MGMIKGMSGVIKAGYKQTEVGLIPEDWMVSSISGSMTLINGYGFKPGEWSTRGLPIIRIQNLNDADAPFNYFNGNIEEKYHIRVNDLLFAWSGSKGTSFGARIWQGEHALLNQHIFKVIPHHQQLTKKYAYLVLHKVQEDIEKMAHGFKSSFVHVKKSDLIKVLLPIPLIKEQTAIAKALSDTDALIQSLNQLIAKKCQIKQGAMQTLFNPYDQCGVLKAGWTINKLGDIASFYKGKGLPKSALVLNGKNKCIHYGELFTKYSENINNILSKTNSSEQSIVSQRNDVLMPTSDVTPNGLATASCIKEDNVILGGDILIIRAFKGELDGVFFSYLVNIERDQVMQLVTGSTVYHLYGSDMAKFEFSMPDNINEQTQIAKIITDMDTEITNLETKRDKYQQIKQGMMQNLLTGRIRLI